MMQRNNHARSRQNFQRLKNKNGKPMIISVLRPLPKKAKVAIEKKYSLKDCVIELDKPPVWGSRFDIGMSQRTNMALDRMMNDVKRILNF